MKDFEINLDETSIEDTGIKTLSKILHKIKKLESLDISLRLTKTTIQYLDIGNRPILKAFSLNFELTEEISSDCSHLSNILTGIPNLESFQLNRNFGTLTEIHTLISKFGTTKNLKKLSLGLQYTKFNNADFLAIALYNLTNLISINLNLNQGYQLQEQQRIHLVELILYGNLNLSTINIGLAYNEITNNFMELFKNLSDDVCHNLDKFVFNITGAKISGYGLSLLLNFLS